MRQFAILMALTVSASLLLTGCGVRNTHDEENIRTLLGTSDYTNDEHSGATDDGRTNPDGGGLGIPTAGGLVPSGDTLAWVRFCRKIERPVPRTIEITIPAYSGYPDTTALATITATPTGQFYVHNDPLRHVAWVKDFTDEGVRKVYLTKHNDTWRIRSITPWNMHTKAAPWTINITSLHIDARPSGLSYEYTTPETMLTKRQLPAFLPGDTVKVTVTVESDSATWAFLHRGRQGHHSREAFYRMTPVVFEREWCIGDDSVPNLPAVRPTATDIISSPTLFGDTLAPYNSCAWTLPYIVIANPNSDRPE
jgi:hypothetical protein